MCISNKSQQVAKYSIVRLKHGLPPASIRKLRGAVSAYMQQLVDNPYASNASYVSPWAYGHDEPPSSVDSPRVPSIHFHLCASTGCPEIAFAQALAPTVLDFLSAAPFQVQVGRRSYKVVIEEVYQRLLTTEFIAGVEVFELSNFVAFAKTHFAAWQADRVALGLGDSLDYARVDHPDLKNKIIKAAEFHLSHALAQRIDEDIPKGALLEVTCNSHIEHSVFRGSNRVAFSAFSGLYVRTNLYLPYHWGIGNERTHGAGSLQRLHI